MAEHQIGRAADLLPDGGMRRLELEDKPVILARVHGEYYAFGGSCSHYGAPLQDGVLQGHTIICPWHHACFDIRSGLRLEPPALNDLPRYPVRIDEDMVTITLPHDNETQPTGQADPADPRTFVIVGGGAAGGIAAEELRRGGFAGRIILVSAAPTLPIDRPNLSKDYLDGHAKPEWIPLRSADWYAKRDIELRLDTAVTRIDLDGHRVHLNQGAPIEYTKLLLATGAVPRQLKDVPGIDLDGVYTLRALADADRIIQATTGDKRAVVIGASFIGMEVAASLASGRGVSVTVVAPEDIPFAPLFGEDIGRMFQQEHEQNGVQFRLGNGIAAITGQDGHVSGVKLTSGETLDADFVVVGIGVMPATGFLRDSGLALHERDQAVRVDRHLRTSHPDVYAAGDIARWDDGSAQGVRIEHWRVAQQHGLVAARNLLGEDQTVDRRVPFFWTTQWGLTLNYVGHATAWDAIIYRGAMPTEHKFVACYVKDGRLLAAAGCGYDTEIDAIELILRRQLPLSPEQLRDPDFDLIAHAQGTA